MKQQGQIELPQEVHEEIRSVLSQEYNPDRFCQAFEVATDGNFRVKRVEVEEPTRFVCWGERVYPSGRGGKHDGKIVLVEMMMDPDRCRVTSLRLIAEDR